jgi:hypothetical protein
MQILNVTALGRAVQNRTTNGTTAIGNMSGTLTARIAWPGVWLTEGDPAALKAQEAAVRALFPDVDITEITITPVAE